MSSLSIGEVVRRSGKAASAIRYYESARGAGLTLERIKSLHCALFA